MANSGNGGGAAPWLAFLVGALIVAIVGFLIFTQINPQRQQADMDVIAPTIEAPSVAPLPAPDVNVNMAPPAAAPPAPQANPIPPPKSEAPPAPTSPGTPY